MRRTLGILGFVVVWTFLSSVVSAHTADRPVPRPLRNEVVPSRKDLRSPRLKVISMGELVYARSKVYWLLLYDYDDRDLKVIFSTLFDPHELEQNAQELSQLTGEVRFVDKGGNTIFMLRQEECTPSQIENLQCKFLDLTSDLHAKLQAFPLFSKVQVKETMQNPKPPPP